MVNTLLSHAVTFFLGWIAKYFLDEKMLDRKEVVDKRKVYNWLKDNTEDVYDSRFKTVFEIAKGTGLPEDRVKHICTVHKDIKLHNGDFGLYENKSIYEERGIITLG